MSTSSMHGALARWVGNPCARLVSPAVGCRWTVERLILDWPIESLLLVPPDSWIYETRAGRSSEFTKIAEEMEVRAWGFSPTGRSLILATSSDVTIYGRATLAA